jgi:hypothetical protein
LIIVLPLAILLFPEGRLPSPRWRWLLWAYLALGAGGTLIVLGSALVPFSRPWNPPTYRCGSAIATEVRKSPMGDGDSGHPPSS